MTKFILVGGAPARTAGNGKGLCEEMIEGFDQPVRILDCVFARPREDWEQKVEEDRFFISSNVRVKVLLTLATSENFIEQLRNTDVLYFKGGHTRLLIDTLAAIPGWEKELAGKTVVGNSAGANFLSHFYYGLTHPGLEQGLGILPIKVIVHYRSDYNAPNIDWDTADAEVQSAGDPEMEVVTLGEEEFKVIQK